jgi:hypothetical protein
MHILISERLLVVGCRPSLIFTIFLINSISNSNSNSNTAIVANHTPVHLLYWLSLLVVVPVLSVLR